MTIDRRVVRTRTALFDALVALIRRMDYEYITVDDILREANVGRATFYAHFASKDDLLKRSLDRLRQLLMATKEASPNAPFPYKPGWSPSRVLFEHVLEFADVQSALAGGRGAAILRNALDDVLAGVLREIMPPGPVDGLPREFAILHVVSTFDTVIRWWLEHRRNLTPEEAEAIFRKLAFSGLPERCYAAFVATPERSAVV